MLYPTIVSMMNANASDQVIEEYEASATNYSNNENEALLEAAKVYNASLTPHTITDMFTNPQDESVEYQNILNVDQKGVMGYISIPKIDVRLPIYHGTSAKVLQKGVGHVEGSSFPIGGSSTHAILSAHRGLPSARLFTDLNQLQIGDMFFIYILDEVLAYQVDQIVTIEPDDTSELVLQEGQDYVTLVTCTPYAINTHRLLVRGRRVAYDQAVVVNTKVEKTLAASDYIFYVGIVAAFLLLGGALLLQHQMKKKAEYNKEIEELEII